MRLVATSDTHYPVDTTMIPDGDVFIHCGDLLRTGYPDDFVRNLDWLAALPHKLKLYTPGNHDLHLQLYPGPALQQLRSVGVWVIGLPGNNNYAAYTLPNGMTILGVPYVTNLPRWAFNATEEEIWTHMQSMGRHDIIMSHAPAYGVLDRVPYRFGNDHSQKHVGIKAFSRYASEYKPKLWLHGHIHEDYGTMQFQDTTFYNVAMCDRNYKHSNSPIVIDI